MAYAWGSLLTAVRTGAPAYPRSSVGRSGRTWTPIRRSAASFDALMGRRARHSRPGSPGRRRLGRGADRGRRRRRHGGDARGDPPRAARRAGHAGRPPEDRGPIRRDLRGSRRGRSRHDGRAELLRPAAGRGRPLPAKKCWTTGPTARRSAILRRCAEAARPAGRVVVLGGVSPDEGRSRRRSWCWSARQGADLAEFRELRTGRAGPCSPPAGNRRAASPSSVAPPEAVRRSPPDV